MSISRILFSFLILFLPTQLGKHFWPTSSLILGIRVDYLSPTLFLTDLLILGLLIVSLWERPLHNNGKTNIFKRYWLPIIIFLYLFLISLLAQNSAASLYKLLKVVEFSLLGFYVAKSSQNYFRSFFLYFLLFAMFYELLIVFGQFFGQASIGGVLWFLGERTFSASTPGIALMDFGGRSFLRPYGTFSHPNSLAGFFLVSLILVVGLGKDLPKWLKFFIVTTSLFVVFISFSRVVWLASILVFIAFCWRKFPKYGRSFLILVPVAFLFLYLPLLKEETGMERWQFLRSASLMVGQYPLTGVGLNNFISYLPRFWPEGGLYFLQPVHNIFMIVLVETGFVGLLAFLWFLYLSFAQTIKHEVYFLTLALLAILFTGLFDHYWWTLQQNQILLSIVCGLIWSSRNGKMV